MQFELKYLHGNLSMQLYFCVSRQKLNNFKLHMYMFVNGASYSSAFLATCPTTTTAKFY